jgi:hypothetical protein
VRHAFLPVSGPHQEFGAERPQLPAALQLQLQLVLAPAPVQQLQLVVLTPSPVSRQDAAACLE